MFTSATVLLLSTALHGQAATLPAPLADGSIMLSARINDRVAPIDLNADATTANGSAGQRLLGRFLEPGEGSVSVRVASGAGLPFDNAVPQEGGVAAGPFWIWQLCVLTNTDPLLPSVIGVTLTLPVSDPSITLGGGSASGMVFDLGSPNGASITSPSASIVVNLIDGAAVEELYFDPFSIWAPPGGIATIPPSAWGMPIPSAPIPAPVTSMSIDVSALISPQDTAILAVLFVIS